MNLRSLVIVAIGLACTYASAQVYRCPDVRTGKITYSDAPCGTGEQIVRERSYEQQQLDAERSALARERFQLEQERRAMQQQQQQVQARPLNLTPPQTGMSHECQMAQKNAWGVNRKQKQREADIICFGADRAADIRAQEEARKPVRTTCVRNGVVTNCVSR